MKAWDPRRGNEDRWSRKGGFVPKVLSEMRSLLEADPPTVLDT